MSDPTLVNQGEAEILRERAQIVAWLRSDQGKGSDEGVDWADTFADAIERGDHLTAQGGEG